jgi:hypothetical protein
MTSAFNKVHSEKSTLTTGARALSKHVNRGSDGYYGTLKGNDLAKNAGEATSLLQCVSMNFTLVVCMLLFVAANSALSTLISEVRTLFEIFGATLTVVIYFYLLSL